MKTLFLVNPAAGRGRGARHWRVMAHILRERAQFPFDVVFTQASGQPEACAREASQEYERIVVVGGDGTVNEVINGITNDVRIGIIPCGTGNDLARALGLPKTTRRVVQMLNHPSEVEVDVAILNNRRFLIAAGMGFDAIVADYINRHSGLKHLGPVGYAYSAFRILATFAPMEVNLHIDGEHLHLSDVWMLAVGNCPYYAGGMKLFPNAKFNDGVLNVCVVSKLNKMKFLRLFPLVYSGNHIRRTDVVTALRGHAIDVEFPAATFAHVDGEPLATQSLSIRLADRPIRFITPLTAPASITH
ncbi:MAG: diacylglycerol kinase family lipid kinase [Alicyclobacillus herbarius]|uniref:diacylglycerol/lipid kinase family protein n=1 Tax=Alicyclobacillus herbarius TaxID=122960 RepID=UPI002354AC57|nr:diacylglycerol kinase family protein [Alicyclobacillus herbarius]MCL6633691.1 diacylglycerol kinase family lipid kinase [Alicyclobacillus herbarius]